MKTKNIIFNLYVVCPLLFINIISCSNINDDILYAEDNFLNVSFSVNNSNTRALNEKNFFEDGDVVGFALLNNTGDDYTEFEYVSSSVNGQLIWKPSVNIQLSDEPLNVFAFYPYNGDMTSIYVDCSEDTDILYGIPVYDVNAKNKDVTMIMKHALTNINISINRGNYKGEGLVSYISLCSDGMASCGDFCPIQKIPGFTYFYDAGCPIKRYVTLTAGLDDIDMLVIPTGRESSIQIILDIDGKILKANSSPVELKMGHIYEFELNLDDIN